MMVSHDKQNWTYKVALYVSLLVREYVSGCTSTYAHEKCKVIHLGHNNHKVNYVMDATGSRNFRASAFSC